jgi:hypothetical protein
MLTLAVIFYLFIVYHPGHFFPKEYTGFRLNRKRLLAMKGSGSESTSRNGYVISSPRPTGSIESKPTWLEVETEEVDAESYAIAR